MADPTVKVADSTVEVDVVCLPTGKCEGFAVIDPTELFNTNPSITYSAATENDGVQFTKQAGGKIRIENILNIVYTDGKMYVSYLWKGFDPTISQIAIKPKHFDKMKDALLAKNPNIVFYNDDENK